MGSGEWGVGRECHLAAEFWVLQELVSHEGEDDVKSHVQDLEQPARNKMRLPDLVECGEHDEHSCCGMTMRVMCDVYLGHVVIPRPQFCGPSKVHL